MFDLTSAPLVGLLTFAQIWLAIPLAVAFSLVYAGTRAEQPREILQRAARVGFWLFFFLILIAVILYIAV